MTDNVTIFYPIGAGGNWLKSTLALTPLNNQKYVNFHGNQQSWVNLKHTIEDIGGSDLIFSGSSYFNFFVNHIYKHYCYEKDIFNFVFGCTIPGSILFFLVISEIYGTDSDVS